MKNVSKRALLASVAIVVLSVQAAATHRILRNYQNFENPARPSLSFTPYEISGWQLGSDLEIDREALEMLAPDDFVSRMYRDPKSGPPIDLFITYYKSQLRDKNAHSPKVCLPGSGWIPVTSRTATVNVPGSGELRVNYYVVAKGQAKNLVLYWYQTHREVVADEHVLKVHRLWNSVRDNRTDMIFVRTISPIENGDEQFALERLTRFITGLQPTLKAQFDQSTARAGL